VLAVGATQFINKVLYSQLDNANVSNKHKWRSDVRKMAGTGSA
jgi:hypothetical protein